MDVALERVLAAVAGHVNPRTRGALLAVLPEALADTVGRRVRSGLAAQEPLDAVEERLLAVLEPPPRHDAGGASGEVAAVTSSADPEPDQREQGVPPEQLEAMPSAVGEEIGSVRDSGATGQGLAVMMGMLCTGASPQDGGALLFRFPLHLQAEIVLALCTRTALSATRGLGDAEAQLVEDLRAHLGAAERWGMQAACQLLRGIPHDSHLRQLISAADQQDHERIAVLRSQLYQFEDLLRLSKPELQTVLLRTENGALGLALTLTEPQVRQRLLQSISTRRRAAVAEESERFAEATLGEVEAAQLQIVATAQMLYEQQIVNTYLGSVAVPGSEPPGTEPAEGKSDRGAGTQSAALPSRPVLQPRVLVAIGIVLATALVWLGNEILGGSSPFTRPSALRATSRVATGRGKVVVRQAAQPGGVARQGHGLPASGTAQEATSSVPGPRALSPGEQLNTLSGVEAVLEFPGAGTVLMGEDTQLSRAPEDAENTEDSPELFLRLGEVRTEALGPRFPVMTPAARVIGERAAVFTVRVVLDGSTEVEVERGTVRVIAMAGSDQALVLTRGESVRIEIAGTASRTRPPGG